ncbi:hypothetical protein RvY_11523-2 [Ramazzottius varieornatus]|uniref:CUB domain-containing protein n=1 Tax=Ramazzottius varieornatus TaxID=947166 RepID=A0A1D1VP58_RAMVA|nr:hypothetical protein RvY_11523-2 [Ramazzottius varieornatus]
MHRPLLTRSQSGHDRRCTLLHQLRPTFSNSCDNDQMPLLPQRWLDYSSCHRYKPDLALLARYRHPKRRRKTRIKQRCSSPQLFPDATHQDSSSSSSCSSSSTVFAEKEEVREQRPQHGRSRPPHAHTHKSSLLILASLACLLCFSPDGLPARGAGVMAFDCDFMRVSNVVNAKNGTFAAPNIPPNIILPAQGLQCIYTFIAMPNERVKVTFRDFEMSGRPPECLREYIDLYTELRNSSEDLVQTDKFGGRFCGRIAPRARVSLYNTIVLVFSTDREQVGPNIFSGNYEFLNASMYDMGTPAPPSQCAFVVKSWVKRLGNFVSPTYPGVYPQRIICSYQLLGQKGQRVRVEFMDFDLFYGGLHCPYDRLVVHDGASEQDPVINTYCGAQRNLVVFSSQENLFISFITNRSGGENRGFHAIFEFSELFVSLEFITGEHLRGTECDQLILSSGRNSGEIRSPNSPFPYLPNVECRYLIEGLNTADELERVKLRIKMFHMPQMVGAAKDDCSAGGLAIWMSGREERGRPAQKTLCGTQPQEEVIRSEDHKILLKFYSGTTQGLGFVIEYEFEMFFDVPGTAHPLSTVCEFSYRSGATPASKAGEFHSPRHPSNYPSNINCTYIFEGADNEQAHLEFDLFTLSGNGTYANTCTQQDYVDFYELVETGRVRRLERPIGRYCGIAVPGPIKTRHGVHALKMHFVTDGHEVTNGFRGRYWFQNEIPTFSPVRGCGEDISNSSHGSIASPTVNDKYPANADCEWQITVRRGHSISLNLTSLAFEGDPARFAGCGGAALRIYTDPDRHPLEVCGAMMTKKGDFRSLSNVMRLAFTSASKSTGGAGFVASWAEFHYPVGEVCEQDEFLCDNSSYCISQDLVCDGVYHCGEGDPSDETQEGCEGVTEESAFDFLSNTYAMAGVAAAAGFVLLGVLVVLIVVCRRRSAEKKRKRQQRQHQDNLQDQWN